MSKITLEQCTNLLDRLAYPERYPDSHWEHWHSGDGPFEDWAYEIAEEYKKIVEEVECSGA